MNETHIPSKASTPPRQKSLSEILDEIEQRERKADAYVVKMSAVNTCNCPPCQSRRDVPALVKALREAESSFEAIAEANHEAWWMRDVASEALRDISALLTSSVDHQMPLSEESPSSAVGQKELE